MDSLCVLYHTNATREPTDTCKAALDMIDSTTWLYSLYTIHTVHYTYCTLYICALSILYTIHTVHYTYCTLYILYTIHMCTIHTVHYTYCTLYILYTIQMYRGPATVDLGKLLSCEIRKYTSFHPHPSLIMRNGHVKSAWNECRCNGFKGLDD